MLIKPSTCGPRCDVGLHLPFVDFDCETFMNPTQQTLNSQIISIVQLATAFAQQLFCSRDFILLRYNYAGNTSFLIENYPSISDALMQGTAIIDLYRVQQYVSSFYELYEFHGRSETLSFESEFNTICSTLASNDALLLIINETGRGYLYNVKCRTLIGIHRFGHDVHTIKFSPDSKSVAVCRSNRYEFYTCPGTDRQFNLFTLKCILRSFHDKTIFINWTSDFLVLAIISADMITQIFSVPLRDKLHRFILVSHVCEIVGAFFEQDSLNAADMDLASMESIPCILGENDDQEIPTSSNGHVDRNDDDNDNEELDDVVERERIKLLAKTKTFNYKETFEGADHGALLLCADHQKTHMLVAGFSNGHFYLHEMPNFNIIHSLSIDDQKQMIASVLFSPLGDWIALVCQNLGQLVV
ncbi:unnamed protein product [Rotaria sp. Silwood1]|nr:unnamed protein product [Rotaria sp. Silwood1]CAF1452590.1 unnamed protein product [Rotaria sp. Silwood1]CAF3580956.1 unnamed protein product [Rotaria sp. Silwood1]CAF3636019.1 unnamed protein product [Rotaria sp. Silwood1]CAF4727259.1 unnamed protein product [Rotaria sp. Silwood1]